MEKVEEFDVLVIGAGISGIAFARFYLETHPTSRLVLVESEETSGGVWSKSRSYDGFWAQSSARMSSFSDAEIKLPYGAPTYHGMFPAKYVSEYLDAYVDEHIYDGTSLRDRIRFGHYVTEVEKFNGQWHVLAEVGSDHEERILAASKLVVATGRTTEANIPQIPNSEQYKGLFLHHKDFAKVEQELVSSDEFENVAVIGGGRSAADIVYQLAKKGKRIHWIIRKNGEGPAVFLPAKGGGQYLNSVEKEASRMSQAYSASSYMPRFHPARLLYKTGYGRTKVERRIAETHHVARQAANYRDRPDALPGFKNLSFDGNVWWMTAPYGVLQHDDFWAVVSSHVHVHRQDIDHATSDSLILSSGAEIPASAVICGTGWNALSFPFLSASTSAALGLPHDPSLDSPSESAGWAHLLRLADARVLRRFPLLSRPPPYVTAPPSTSSSPFSSSAPTPCRLYRSIAPLPPAGEENGLKARSIVFVGLPETSNAFRAAEAQAAWATGWFDGAVPCPPLREARNRVAYAAAFSARRYPSRGRAGDCLMGELVWYTDALLRDLGLRSHKRCQGWRLGLARWRKPCVSADLRDVPAEYRRRHGGRI